MLYIVPGFLAVTIFRFFTAMKLNGLFLWVESAAISFLSLAILQLTTHGVLSEWALCVLSCLGCAICAGLLAWGFRSPRFETLCTKHFHISTRDSVLHDAVDWHGDTMAIIQFRNSNLIYTGSVRTISNPTDPTQWICLDAPVQLNEEYQPIWPHGDISQTSGYRMVVHLDDLSFIHFI